MKKNILNKLLLFLNTILICVLSYSITYARNQVSKIDMDVLIKNGGMATITQRWTGYFDEGTEVYVPIEDKNLVVKNLKVSKDGRDYLEVDKWDVDASFERKSFRSGINRISTGVELCFGISEYGNNTYVFSYDIDPLVRSYTDYDGFNFQFINPNMSTFPTSVNIKVRMDDGKEMTTDNTLIWGFGFDGTVLVNNGTAMGFSNEPLDGNEYANIMMRFNKGLISPNVKVDASFDDTLLNIAFEDSDYVEVIDSERRHRVMVAIFFGFISLTFIIPIIAGVRRYLELHKFYKECNYFRDTPNGGDIALTHVLFNDFNLWNNKDSNTIAALIMKIINDKNLLPIQEKSYGFFGREKINTSLKVGSPPTVEIVRELYDIIVRAAGSDGILQEDELKKYAKQDYEVLVDFLNVVKRTGKNSLNSKGCYKKLFGKKLSDLTDVGKMELAEIYGLRKFLDEFTLIKERSIIEGVIWENLLVYATLIGIADKVLSELKRLYPEKIVEIEHYTNTVYVSNVYFRALYMSSVQARNAVNAARMAQMAASGLGGAVSHGGGGGFSGGGGGGGTR